MASSDTAPDLTLATDDELMQELSLRRRQGLLGDADAFEQWAFDLLEGTMIFEHEVADRVSRKIDEIDERLDENPVENTDALDEAAARLARGETREALYWLGDALGRDFWRLKDLTPETLR